MTPGGFGGRTAIISGGAAGVGRAASLRFAALGAAVAIVDIQQQATEELVALIESRGGAAFGVVADVARGEDCRRAVDEAVDRLGPPHILVNHAGTVVVKPFLETTSEDWRRLNDVNVMSMIEMTRTVLPHMLAAGGGRIVNTASISGLTASPLEVAYCVTKGAVVQLTRGIAVEFRDRGIRCNAVCPGFIRTAHGEREMAALTALGQADVQADIRTLQGRLCEPEEVAEAIVFLAGDGASFVNGAMLVVDNGGLAAT